MAKDEESFLFLNKLSYVKLVMTCRVESQFGIVRSTIFICLLCIVWIWMCNG